MSADGDAEARGSLGKSSVDLQRGLMATSHAGDDQWRIESAVQHVLASGLRTGDIWSEGTTKVGTREMGEAVVSALSTIKTITKKG